MSNLKDQTIALLKSHGLYTKKSFGQNFLINEQSLQTIIDAAEITPTDNILEIGAGTGILTRELAKLTKNLTSLEKDESLKPVLKDLPVTFTDALQFNPEKLPKDYKIVANIPYYITSPLINQFLKNEFLKGKKGNPPKLIVLLIQKEVAEKITNEKRQSVLSINIKCFGSPTIVGLVPKDHFFPAPKVDSAILKIKVHEKPQVNCDLKKFFATIHKGFTNPRKKLQKNIDVSKTDIDPNLRPENLTLKDWEQITQSLS